MADENAFLINAHRILELDASVGDSSQLEGCELADFDERRADICEEIRYIAVDLARLIVEAS